MSYKQLILPLFLLLLSCKNDTNFKITGSVSDNSLDGEYIYLQEIRENKLVNLDSVIVKEGTFSFQGITDSAVIRELNFHNADSHVINPLVFVLEPGNMKAYIDTTSYMTGTQENDALYNYNKEQRQFARKLEKVMEEYQNMTAENQMTDSLLLSFQGRYDVINTELNTLAYDFILKNYDSVAGALVFLQTYSYLNSSQIENVFELAGPVFRNVQGVHLIMGQFMKEKNVSVGMDYVDFTLPDSLGNSFSVSSFLAEGKWVLLDFWASWCSPCREEIPYLLEAHKKYASQNLQIIGVSLDNQRVSWLKAIQKYQQPWLQLSDLKGWDSLAAQDYAIDAIPYTVLISPEGKIVAKGMRREDILLQLQFFLKK